MVKLFQSVMVKPMLINQRGFTLIETLFVLMIICILSTLSLSLHIPKKSEDIYIEEISQFFQEAQLQAMTQKKKVTIQINTHELFYKIGQSQSYYQLPKNTYFENHTITYNCYGHIKNAKTLTFHGSKKNYLFIFQVGSGYFYVQS